MMVAEAQVAHKDAREQRSSLASQQRPSSLSDCPQSLMDWDIDVVPERLQRISWAFSRMSGNWSPICRRVVQVVHEWFDWFTTGSRLVLFGSPVVRLVHFGSPVVQVVHDWFAWFTGGSSGSRLVHVVQEWLTLSGPIT